MSKDIFSKLKEECGVFGAYNLDGEDVSSLIYYGLFALQHRGQESCGIAVSDTSAVPCSVSVKKGMGLVGEVFSNFKFSELKGNIGVGHVRYSTAGESKIENAQPLVFRYIKGTLSLAHNGNLINAPQLREEFARNGAIYQTTIDSEVIGYAIAKERVNSKTSEEAVIKAMSKLQGAYSLVITTPKKLIGVRDPWGFRPLCIGKKDNTYFLSSESCALDSVGAEFIRDVAPGEVVVITKNGLESYTDMCKTQQQGHCIFEYVYFARPDSYIDKLSVYNARLEMGKCLAKDSFTDADVVVGVPESGNIAAMGYALQSGIPLGTAFIKNAYIGRTFIKPKQETRLNSVKIKLNVLKAVVKDKRVIMIDDSIVRGTTSKLIVTLLKEAGAKEVHVKVSSPMFLHPCYFGTDVPYEKQLIAHNRTEEEIAQLLGADSVSYLRVERLHEIAQGLPICTGCFDKNYPMTPPTEDIRGEFTE